MIKTLRYAVLIFDYFFVNDTATTEIYTLSLHDALPISGPCPPPGSPRPRRRGRPGRSGSCRRRTRRDRRSRTGRRSEEHTSELQSRQYLVCRLLLEKKKTSDRPRPPLTSLPSHLSPSFF